MKPTAPLLLAAVFVLAGCWPQSLHPLYDTEDQLVFDPAIEGVWQQDETQYEFRRREDEDDKGYTLTVSSGEHEPTQFVARLVELGGRRFLDVTPVFGQEGVPAHYAMTTLPTHTIARATLADGVLQLALMDLQGIEARLQEQPDLIAHERPAVVGVEGEANLLMLTAPTPALRAFVASVADDEALFKIKLDLQRVVEPAP